MALGEAERVAVRRHLGYPLYGGTPTPAFGHRFMTHYGTLEFRMTNMSAAEEEVVRTTYLANLTALETDVFGVRSNLDTASAAVWTRNATEHADREALYRAWQSRLANFLGVPVHHGTGAARGLPLVV